MSAVRYAIIDIETTGGRADREKITEIAIIIHDGTSIIDRYETLIDPQKKIPYNITRLTGITNEMVRGAPKFYEIAKKVVEITENCIFVAHNVRFDYSFIKEEFSRLGYVYTRKQLCTVRLTRKNFPGLRSYGLSNLIKVFNLPLVGNRHRAMADTYATTILLEKNFKRMGDEDSVKEIINKGVKESLLPSNINLEKLHNFPETCGVYYMYDKNKDIVYIGKSINIQKRLMQHFAKKTNKAAKLQAMVHEIDYEETGSELIALLKESEEIKAQNPPVNRAQKTKKFPYVVFQYENEDGYLCLDFARNSEKIRTEKTVLSEFPTMASAKSALNYVVNKFKLCTKYCNLDKTETACFNFHIKKCAGACCGKEMPTDYNVKVVAAHEKLNIYFETDLLILDTGRTADEYAVVLVQHGKCQGYGYIDKELTYSSLYNVIESIPSKSTFPETAKLIKGYLATNKPLKVIKLTNQMQAFL